MLGLLCQLVLYAIVCLVSKKSPSLGNKQFWTQRQRFFAKARSFDPDDSGLKRYTA